VKRQHWLHGKLYIVENVEAEVCAECGERYYHAKTLDAVDEFLSKQHAVEERLSVEVVRFNQMAA
jgi:YgiT-type zinc finger domain-containing protein